ncbi:MAG: hypothetical protein DRJ51_01030 [Thermoprotei archaeon]|nr:MAG: hypothetical protein DRJ51_01030 [Thermoprotei archaeon]RLE99969.1 MAG: hypothetical protein DRJ59_07570 [Thermoprotei archaeon]
MREGQVQIISTLLLIVITISAWILIWIWFYPQYWSNYLFLQKELLEGEKRLSENIVIENVLFNSTTISIYITNTGSIEVEIGSVYINQENVWSGSIEVKVDENLWINVTYSYESGQVYSIKVCSMRGNCWEVKVRAP